MYSGQIPDQEVHPGISKTIILDESIFPEGISYTVRLVNEEGEIVNLPWWITYIANERKLLMFPSSSEVGQDFKIRISGYDGGALLESEFSIKVRNKDPVVKIDLDNQRIKLGDSLEYQIQENTFIDEDNDPLSYSVVWVKENGDETVALPSWISFEDTTQTFYGIPIIESNFMLAVIADDGYGGSARKEFVIETFNHPPSGNSDLLQSQSIHIGNAILYTCLLYTSPSPRDS